MSDLFSDVSEISRGDIQEPRDLDAELFNKKSIQELLVNFEGELGLKTGRRNKTKSKRHIEVFNPEKDEDKERLTAILNEDDRFRILSWDKTWTAHGNYRVALIYEEIIKPAQHDK